MYNRTNNRMNNRNKKWNPNDLLLHKMNNMEIQMLNIQHSLEIIKMNMNYGNNERNAQFNILNEMINKKNQLSDIKREMPPYRKIIQKETKHHPTNGSPINSQTIDMPLPIDQLFGMSENKNGMIPLMIIGNMENKSEERKNKFEEIKIPDMSKEIRKKVNISDLDNFVELNLLNLDQIAEKGREFQKLANVSIAGEQKKPVKTEPTIDLEQHLLSGIDNLIRFLGTQSNPKEEKKEENKKEEMDSDKLYTFHGKRYSINPYKIMKLVRPIDMLNSMVGMKDVKENIYHFISHFLQNDQTTSMLNTAIYGKPGVGKTDLGKILCMIYSALGIIPSERFQMVRASDMIGRYVGETRQKTKKILDDAEGGVLFIDEAYSLMSGSGDKYSYGKECIDTINQELSENRRKLICIIAGYEKDIEETFFAANPGLERRFPFRYTLKGYDAEEMKDIFLRMIRLDDIMLDREVRDRDIIRLFEDKDYFENYGGDVENLLTKCKFANNIRSLGKHPMLRNVLTNEDLIEGMRLFKYHKKIDNAPFYKNMFI